VPTAGLRGALTIALLCAVLGFRLTIGAVGPDVANNFLVIPIVVLLALLVGVGCAVVGVASAGALFLVLGLERHLTPARLSRLRPTRTRRRQAAACGP
jgi:hypothetical protein